MHSTEIIRSSYVINIIKLRHAASSGRCKMNTSCVLSTSWTLHPLPENSPDLHGLEIVLTSIKYLFMSGAEMLLLTEKWS